MADNPSVLQITQLGLEVTEGTTVAATKRVLGISSEVEPQGNIDTYTPDGYLFPTAAIPGEQWSTAKLNIAPCFNALTYIYQSLVKKVTPTNNSGAYTWSWDVKSTNLDPIQTYTLEHGSVYQARQVANAFVNEFGMEFTRTAIKPDGAVLAKIPVENFNLSTAEVQTLTITGGPTGGTFTLTFSGQTTAGIAYNATAATVQTALQNLSNIGANNVTVTGGTLPGGTQTITFVGSLAASPQAVITGSAASLTGGTTPAVVITETTPGVAATEVAAVPMLPGNTNLWVDSTAAGLGTTKLTRGFQFSFKLGNRNNTIWPIDSTQTSWAARVADMPSSSVTAILGCDTAGLAYLTQMNAGTKLFFRVQTTGTAVGGGTYTHTANLCVFLDKVYQLKKQGAVYAIQFDGRIAHDPTWAKAANFTLINGLAAL